MTFEGLPYLARWYTQGEQPLAELPSDPSAPWEPLFKYPGEPSATESSTAATAEPAAEVPTAEPEAGVAH